MAWDTIVKEKAWRVQPNLLDYQQAYRDFSWQQAMGLLDGLPGGRGLNIAYEAVDRHAKGKGAGRLAIRWLGREGQSRDLTYAELSRLSSRFANVLGRLGVRRGDRVFTLLGRVPELYVTAFGTLKYGAVLSPLFSAFGPEPVRQRMAIGGGRLLVTTPDLYRRRVAPIRDQLPHLRHVLLVGPTPEPIPDALDFAAEMAAASEHFEIPPTDPEDPALVHFTSGTTGTPKGAVHVHGAVVAHHVTGRLALDLHQDDIFWCTADPGWVTGTSYGIIAPLTNGLTIVVDEGDFDAERWYSILQEQRVTVWYTAPTAIRMLIKAGAEMARGYRLEHLRFIASVGEPLNADAVVWGQQALGLPIHDNWWQTETGGIMIANFAAIDIKPGSMGRPLPGIEAAVLRRRRDGKALVRNGRAELAGSGESGELALRPGWPSMFRTYLHNSRRYRNRFRGGWYLTGDLVRQDSDGYFWFLGRADDVIKTQGHLIGPFEVESVLEEHPAVVEAGVIGKPDPVAGEVIKAFVMLRPGTRADEDLELDLIGFARKRLGAVAAPKEIAFAQVLPHTRSGKIMRRLLKARELGLPEGDVSTLESVAS